MKHRISRRRKPLNSEKSDRLCGTYCKLETLPGYSVKPIGRRVLNPKPKRPYNPDIKNLFPFGFPKPHYQILSAEALARVLVRTLHDAQRQEGCACLNFVNAKQRVTHGRV